MYTLVQSTNGIRRSLKHFRDAFLFTVAQILRGVSLSELHFYTPLGAGGAGATPRRVRTAYSRTRCLPHPTGWASAPTGRLCGVLAGRSLWACKVTIRTAGRCGSVYPVFSSNPLLCPCPGHFAEAGCGKTRRCQDREMPPGSWVICPASRCLLLCCPSQFRGGNITLRQSHTKGPTARFGVFEVYGCYPTRRWGTNRPTTRNRRLHGLELRRGMRIVVIGREILPINARCPIVYPKLFWQVGLCPDSCPFDYSRVVFSFITF